MSDDILKLLLGSAILNGIVGAGLNYWSNRRLQTDRQGFEGLRRDRELAQEAELRERQWKEDRLKVASELVRLNRETVLEGARQSRGEVALFDPAVQLADYLVAVDEIMRTGRWQKGDRMTEPQRTHDRLGNRIRKDQT